MGSLNKAPSWADQWGGMDAPGGDMDDHNNRGKTKGSSGGGQKMAKAKAMASTGLDKAKTATVVGAQKAKTGAVVGFKWLKTQYQKRTSK